MAITAKKYDREYKGSRYAVWISKNADGFAIENMKIEAWPLAKCDTDGACASINEALAKALWLATKFIG